MPDELDLSAGLLPESPKPRRGGFNRDRILEIARADNIPDDIADDFAKVMNFESGGSHFDRRGKVKLSPPDPKTGERAVGLTQIKPSTARGVGVKDPFDENENLKAGLRYFAQGGSDPAGRRIHYFGGPGPLKKYQRTGRIPKGKDVLGTTFEKYVQQTGAKAKSQQKIDLSAGLVDNLEAGLEDSEQILPPPTSKSETQEPRNVPVNPALAKSAPSDYWERVRTRMQVPTPTRPPARRPGLIDSTIPDLTKVAQEQPLTFEQDRAARAERNQAVSRLRGRAGAATDFQGEEYKNFLLLNRSLDSPRQRQAFLDLKAKQAVASAGGSPLEALRIGTEESERQNRLAKLSTAQKAAQVPKSLVGGLASGAGGTLKGLAVIARKGVDQITDTKGFDTRESHVYQLGEYISQAGRDNPVLKSNPDLEQEFLIGKAPNAIGQSALFLLGGWASQSPKLAVSILGAGMSAGDAYDEVRALGGTDDQATNAGLIAGAILGPSELLGMRGAMKALEGTAGEATLRAALKTALKEGRKDAIENALQEVGQEFVQGKITGRGRSLEELVEAGTIGAIASGVTTPSITLASQVGGRRGTQTEVQPPAEAQRAPVEPGPTTAEVGSRGMDVSARPEVVAPETRAADTELPETTARIEEAERGSERRDVDTTAVRPGAEPAPQRFYHKDWGEVEVLEDQSGANKGKVKVAEVADPTKIHFPRRADLTGRGNQRMVPVKLEPSADSTVSPEAAAQEPLQLNEVPNLEAGLEAGLEDSQRVAGMTIEKIQDREEGDGARHVRYELRTDTGTKLGVEGLITPSGEAHIVIGPLNKFGAIDVTGKTREPLGAPAIRELRRYLSAQHPEVRSIRFRRQGSTGGESGRERGLEITPRSERSPSDRVDAHSRQSSFLDV